jgi:hypothetical protein
MQAARDRGAVIHHVIHCHRHGGVMALDHHAERVADQHHIHAGGIQQRGEGGVIGGQAGDLLAALFHLRERIERHRRPLGVTLLQVGIHRQLL